MNKLRLNVCSSLFRENLPDEWMKKLDSFRRIIILKCIRPDKVTNGMQDVVAENIGQRFIEPQVSHIKQKYFKLNQSFLTKEKKQCDE